MLDVLANVSAVPTGNFFICAMVATISLTCGRQVERWMRMTTRTIYPAVAGFAPTRATNSSRKHYSFWEEDGIFAPPPSKGRRMAGELWTALGAVIVAIVGPVVAYKIKQKQDASSAAQFKAGLEDTNALMLSLSAFAAYGSPRTILWAGHNGGGLPAGGSPFYTTAVHRVIAPGHIDVPGSYSKLLVDAAYVRMLIDTIGHLGQAVHLVTAKMRSCQLKDYYEAEGVTASLIIGLGIKDAKFYYISLARYEGDFERRDITLCEQQANTVWNTLTGGKRQ